MIRDKYKVYGELNDPDTVLASGELPANSFVVGAGNKGVKALIPGANKILTTDSYGNPITVSYAGADKVLGTDENGNLMMLDANPVYTVINPTVKKIDVLLVNGYKSATVITDDVSADGSIKIRLNASGADSSQAGRLIVKLTLNNSGIYNPYTTEKRYTVSYSASCSGMKVSKVEPLWTSMDVETYAPQLMPTPIDGENSFMNTIRSYISSRRKMDYFWVYLDTDSAEDFDNRVLSINMLALCEYAV